jgi:nitroreductase
MNTERAADIHCPTFRHQDPPMNVIAAIKSRHSVRAFQKRAVTPELIRQILDAARHAPSGVNTQPWHVAVLQGRTLSLLGDEILAARAANIPDRPDYQYYPREWAEPFTSRRIACGLALYGALRIEHKDPEGRLAQWNKNYRFFGAPVGLIVMIDRAVEQGSWMDLGMFINSIMLAAREFGLGTCPQAALAEHPDIVREVLHVTEPWAIACGIALGYEDEEDAVNQYRTEREDVESFTLWYD